MKQNTFLQTTAFLLLILICSCGNRNENTERLERSAYIEERNPVEIMLLEKGSFTRQIVSNGKLEALRKSELRFRTSGEIARINAANGHRVSRGQLIAALNDFDSRKALQQATDNMQRSRLDFHDVLIGLGYEPADSASIPPDKLELARVRSGYAAALTNQQMEQQKLADCSIKAPFDGVIANITNKVYENTSSEPFCTLIDDSSFEVSFKVLESELPQIALSMPVIVIPFADQDKTYSGSIGEINPVVDRNGLVDVKAIIKNNGDLIEGMNVRVLIENEVPEQYVVPKEAVVLRDNWEVLFKITKGKAYWNYVQIVHENSSNYAVIPHPEKSTASLNPGDTIIVSGNLNLAHESEVTF